MVSVTLAENYDQEENNGLGYSQFHRPPTWAYNDFDDNRIIVWVKTNNVASETSAEIRNSNEEVIWSRNYTEANTQHRDTLELNEGCYRFNVLDSGDDGLNFWANNDGGGYARIKKVAGGNFYTIEEDFGKYISQAFRFETDLVSDIEEVEIGEESIERDVRIFPNPTNSNFKASLIILKVKYAGN